MAELRQNTWELNKWYAEFVAGTQGPYVGLSETWVFGYNDDSGYLGQNSIINRSSPVQLSGNNWNTSAFRTNFGSPSSSAALVPKTDGTLWVWGIGSEGQLGLNQGGPTAKKSSPTQIPGISASSTFSIGELVGSSGGDDGELFVWGRNYNGTFGQNGAIDPSNSERRSSPVQIAGTTWRSINGFSDGSYDRMMATKTDGTLWMWGTNGSEGLLGLNQNGPTSQYSSPTQVGTDTTWSTENHAQRYGSHAIKTDGTLWTWGRSYWGFFGTNTNADIFRSSPIQVPGTTWSKVSGSANGAVTAVKTDGTLWGWGLNEYGMLGLNETHDLQRSSPTQIPGTTWSDVRSVSGSTLATKTDGTAWSWGYNWSGGLGLNNQTYYSSPVQIPGTSWTNPTWLRRSVGVLQKQV